jgi:hypothetical protein
MPAPYATRADVFVELDPRGFVARPRPIEGLPGAVDTDTGTILLVASAFETDDRFRFSVVSGGTLPEEFLPLIYYRPIPLGFDLFKVASPTTGLPIAPLVDAGSGWSITIDPLIRLDRLLLKVSGEVEQDLAAEEVPLLPDPITGKYHERVVGVVAREVGRRAVTSLMFDNAAYRVATDRLFATADADAAQREAWRNGQPLKPRPALTAVDQDAMRATGRAAIGFFKRSRCGGPTL